MGAFFWSKLKPGAQPIAADDVAEIRYLPLGDIDLSQIGNNDVRAAVRKLQQLFTA